MKFMPSMFPLYRQKEVVLSPMAIPEHDNTSFYKRLFGGDQLTVVRARGAIELHSLHAKAVDHLEGVMPVVEDWHVRMTLMKVLWNRLYSKGSVSERGTMYQMYPWILRRTKRKLKISCCCSFMPML